MKIPNYRWNYKFLTYQLQVSYIPTTIIYCLLSLAPAVLPTVQMTYGFSVIPEISPALGSRVVLR